MTDAKLCWPMPEIQPNIRLPPFVHRQLVGQIMIRRYELPAQLMLEGPLGFTSRHG
jgi:hypothetical protein